MRSLQCHIFLRSDACWEMGRQTRQCHQIGTNAKDKELTTSTSSQKTQRNNNKASMKTSLFLISHFAHRSMYLIYHTPNQYDLFIWRYKFSSSLYISYPSEYWSANCKPASLAVTFNCYCINTLASVSYGLQYGIFQYFFVILSFYKTVKEIFHNIKLLAIFND